MNYLPLIALCLGLISIIITLKTLNKYDDLNNTLSKVSIKNTSTYPNELIKIQNKLDLSDKDLMNKIAKKEDKIISLLKEPFKQVEQFLQNNSSFEQFTNQEISYLTEQQRQYSLNLPMNTSTIIKSIETEPNQRIYTYEDEKRQAQYAITKQPKVKSNINQLEL
jgi:dsDNA-specific endonuclease/ATPase MutS2